MFTRPGGYPLDAWGADGYGIACGDEGCVSSTAIPASDARAFLSPQGVWLRGRRLR